MERGDPAGWWNPLVYRIAPPSIPVGSHVAHAAGFAWGLRRQGKDGCVLTYFGDGATSEGSFHEGMNYGAVMRAPVVFLCNNNGWAISTPLERQTAARSIADKASGYGMPGVRVDGSDVLAVRLATLEALDRARAGGGPTLIEAVTYRAEPHTTADDARYLDPRRVEEEKRNDCVTRFERYLDELGLFDPELTHALQEEASALTRDAMREAESWPAPDPNVVFDNVYSNPPASVESDREDFWQSNGP
jgi:pyruvate dehydrogenase E1 component alpha subunit